jgi:hypothetical protein
MILLMLYCIPNIVFLRNNFQNSKLIFVPFLAACMTWDLAESGKDFITSLVNRNDIVPAFLKASSGSLPYEVP